MGFLDGKAVVVTGAGSGLGEAYARHAAREGACGDLRPEQPGRDRWRV